MIMLDFSVSLLPLLVVALVNFFASWLYYSPSAPWFKTWQKNIGTDPNKTVMTDEERKAMPRLMGGAVLASFLFSYGLQVLVHSVGATGFGAGAAVGLAAWAAFVVSHSLNTQFEGRKPVVLIINNSLYAATYALFGGLVAVWR
jgi:hypothetical protein